MPYKNLADKRENSRLYRLTKKASGKKYHYTKERLACYRRSFQVSSKFSSRREYESVYFSQGGLCAICQTPIPHHFRDLASAHSGVGVAIDHDHETGFVRGILCRNCNVGLGMFGDSIDKLTAALSYLMAAKEQQNTFSENERKKQRLPLFGE
jgi:hypothetical protein